jgi:hypothetical protein
MTKIAVKMEVKKLKYKMERARRSVGSGSAAPAPVGRLPGVALGSLTFPPTLNMRIPENKKTGMVYSLRKQIRTMIEDEKKTLTSINVFPKDFSCFSMKPRSYFCAARRKSAKNSVRPSLRFPGGDRGIESSFSSEGFSKLETERSVRRKRRGVNRTYSIGLAVASSMMCYEELGRDLEESSCSMGDGGRKRLRLSRGGGWEESEGDYLPDLVGSELALCPSDPSL